MRIKICSYTVVRGEGDRELPFAGYATEIDGDEDALQQTVSALRAKGHKIAGLIEDRAQAGSECREKEACL